MDEPDGAELQALAERGSFDLARMVMGGMTAAEKQRLAKLLRELHDGYGNRVADVLSFSDFQFIAKMANKLEEECK